MKRYSYILSWVCAGLSGVAVAAGRYPLLQSVVDLDRSERLYAFDRFDLADWTIRRHHSEWRVVGDELVGGNPDAPTHGQIFYKTPVTGDVVLEFDARIVPPSYHDLVWLWNVRFDRAPWGDGYLGSLNGWWKGLNGIERLPAYSPSAIAPGFSVVPGKTYHIVSGSVGGEQFIFVDGALVSYMTDAHAPDASKPGHFGFGIYRSMAAYSHLRVYRPFVEKTPRQYVPASRLLPPEGTPPYLVVDLSAGPSAPSYPVTARYEAPDVAHDACRTTELWLRRIEPGAFTVEEPGFWTGVWRGLRKLFNPCAWFAPLPAQPRPGSCVETHPYYMGVFPVTQGQWKRVVGTDPSDYKGEGRPVEKVRYDDIRGAVAGSRWPESDAVDGDSFMGRLRKRTGLRFDLPTGSQWELAARAGTTTRFNDGTDGPEMSSLGRYVGNTNDWKGGFCEHTTVGLYRPNALGIYDMHGNVWETTADWFADDSRTAATNWPGPVAGRDNMRSRRGGSWAFDWGRCGSADVGGDPPDTCFSDLGFRAACFFDDKQKGTDE